MEPFTTLTAIPAPLPLENVDTDMIVPKQFLKTIKRTGLREGLFYEMRYTVDGTKVKDFVLHREPYTKAGILIAGVNFGCGSSREHAPWALLDFGIRAVIAPSFADIFYNNCFKNGILPLVLPQDQVDQLMAYAEKQPGKPVTVDLPSQTVKTEEFGPFSFEIEEFRKHCLLEGLDDIALTLKKTQNINEFEGNQRDNCPWLYAA